MKIVNWNIARHAPAKRQAKLMLERIAAEDPDVVCLTEAHEASLASLGGHQLAARGVRWSKEAESERKVVLWSRNPWTDPVDVSTVSGIGGAVGGVTETQLGPLRIIGVCIPYWRASPVGLEPRALNWSQHLAFLDGLEDILAVQPDDHPLVVVGDFNQRIPSDWGPHAVRRRLEKAFHGFSMITRGDIAPMDEPTIDHVAVRKLLRAKNVRGLSRLDDAGKALSDHFGVVVELEAGGVQIFD